MHDLPTLDTTGEVWRGIMPGLGEVRVDPAGAVTTIIQPAPGDDEPEQPDAGEDPAFREAALRFGWGEALSWSRRGFDLAQGAAASPPWTPPSTPDAPACLILSGDSHEVAIALIELATRGWQVLGDRFTPVRWIDDILEAQPREAPLLMSSRRLDKAELNGERVRLHSDSRRVDLPRAAEPRPVAAFCQVLRWKAGDDRFVELRGHERFEAAASAFVNAPWSNGASTGGSEAAGETFEPDVDDTRDVRQVMAEHLRLAQFPMSRMYLDGDTAPECVDSLIDWWSRVTGSAAASA